MITHPNCKINLGLNVVAKRPDGYHNLESVFLPVGLTDTLEIQPADHFAFLQDGIPIDGDPMANLVVKAYRLLLDDYPDKVQPVNIRLTKNIPFGAGLGGGSADAAFTLKMVNELFHLDLTDEQLEDHARRLGADCAFFIKNRPVYAFERGDRFEPIDLDLGCYDILLLKPDCGVSTAAAYRGLTPKPSLHDLRQSLRQPINQWRDLVGNDFEASVFGQCPEIATLKQTLYDHGALYASMSGSGSTVFGLFPKGQCPSLDLPQSVFQHISQ